MPSTTEGVEQAAVVALFKQESMVVLGESTIAKLTIYLKQEGLSVPELDIVPPSDVEYIDDWKEEKMLIGKEAGLGAIEQVRFVRWLRGLGAGKSGGAEGKGSTARAVLSCLAQGGVKVDASMAAALENTLRASAAGAAEAEYGCVEVVFIIYHMELPGEETVKWWNGKAKGLSASGLTTGARHATIDIRGEPCYSKRANKTTLKTLEGALKLEGVKGEVAIASYFSSCQAMLIASGYPHAASRVSEIVAFTHEIFTHQPDKRKLYLKEYFFGVFLGVGVPAICDSMIVARLQASPEAIATRDSIEHQAPAGASPDRELITAQLEVQRGMMALLERLGGGGGGGGGGGESSDRIKELPPLKEPVPRCDFCHVKGHRHDVCSKFIAARKAEDSSEAAKRRAREAKGAEGA
jgi:hypothetical protein